MKKFLTVLVALGFLFNTAGVASVHSAAGDDPFDEIPAEYLPGGPR